MSFDIISVVGPTASGKSELALNLAAAIGETEIINTDAMQLYAGMDIGTAKLSAAEMRGIKHHLISMVSPEREVSAVEYRELFDESYREIRQQAHQVLTVGGSTLYLSAALDDLGFSPTDPLLRERLESEHKQLGERSMWERLRELDPATADKIPASNHRRVIRALEVIELTGKPYPNTLPEPTYRRKTIQLGIMVSREILVERIRVRVETMWRTGMLEEVSALLTQYPNLSRTARVAIGYKQAADQLDGKLSEDEAVAETVLLTTRYAKKQMTWFRRDKRIHWLEFDSDMTSEALRLIRLEQ